MEQHDSPLKILLVDDDEDDYILTRDLFNDIEGTDFELDWAATYATAMQAIGNNEYDVYFIDYRLGAHSGLDLIQEIVANGCEAPVILLTGQGDHEVDMDAMKAGAADYLVKGRIDAEVLERSIRYSLERKNAELRQERLIAELRNAMDKIKTLGGLLPICANCKRIRDDKGYWNLLESYIKEHSGAEFSHGICPPCMAQLYPGLKVSQTQEDEDPEYEASISEDRKSVANS
ncbi:MAG: response regulator [Chloroflexi bacterium]|nr:response regulator [Chloroflexota bacterium]